MSTVPCRITEQHGPEETSPLVSVCCITYNHENYIRECLDGFLMQETVFPVEVLIHDDASTDRTADIIREYESKYPNIIKPIYQTENQYSKGIKPNITFNHPRVRGKYIAFCEGDDFWSSPNKLQVQVDYMEMHPDYSACIHNVMVLHEDSGERRVMFNEPMPATYSLEDISSSNRVPMPSVLYRARLFSSFPDWFYRMPIGDWPMHVLNAEHGDIGYLDQVLATYRVHGGGVWSRLSEIEVFKANITVAMAIDKHLGYRFTKSIGKNVAYWNYRIATNMLQSGAQKGVVTHLLKSLRCEHEEIPRHDVYRTLFKILAPGVYWRWDRLARKLHQR